MKCQRDKENQTNEVYCEMKQQQQQQYRVLQPNEKRHDAVCRLGGRGCCKGILEILLLALFFVHLLLVMVPL